MPAHATQVRWQSQGGTALPLARALTKDFHLLDWSWPSEDAPIAALQSCGLEALISALDAGSWTRGSVRKAGDSDWRHAPRAPRRFEACRFFSATKVAQMCWLFGREMLVSASRCRLIFVEAVTDCPSRRPLASGVSGRRVLTTAMNLANWCPPTRSNVPVAVRSTCPWCGGWEFNRGIFLGSLIRLEQCRHEGRAYMRPTAKMPRWGERQLCVSLVPKYARVRDSVL